MLSPVPLATLAPLHRHPWHDEHTTLGLVLVAQTQSRRSSGTIISWRLGYSNPAVF